MSDHWTGRPLRRLLIAALAGVALAAPAHPAGDCIDINAAPVEQLRLIIHIDEVRAPEIVAHREQRRFAAVRDLTRVKGIGPQRIADIVEQGLACVRD